MSELRKTMTRIKPTNSTGIDTISMKTLKELFKPLEGAILNLINTSITNAEYPDNLKISKAIPLHKQGKQPHDPLGYRLINLLPSLSKIIDKIIYSQVLNYLDRNEIMPHQHHGGRRGRSKITAVSTMLDTWTERYENGHDTAIIVLDQSAAYDTISHKILIDKMKVLGFNDKTTKYFENYLNNRQQSVLVDGSQSDTLHVGKISVVQGSVLSCLLYLIYIMDLPINFDNKPTKPHETDIKNTPELYTFVDDTVCQVKLDPKIIANQDAINQAIHKLEIYMRSNSLIVNTDKTNFLVLTKNEEVRKNLYLETQPKNIRPVRYFKFLGITIEDSLLWNAHLVEGKDYLLSRLKTRLTSLRKCRKYIDFQLAKMLANGIFTSKLSYGAELWLGAPKYIKKKIQSTQLEAARVTIGKKSQRWSTSQLLSEMGCDTVENTLKLSNAKMTHKILNENVPEIISHWIKSQLPPPEYSTQNSVSGKIGPRPRNIRRTTITKSHYRSNAYHVYSLLPQSITEIKENHRLKKWTKRFLKNKNYTPDKNKKNTPAPHHDITEKSLKYH